MIYLFTFAKLTVGKILLKVFRGLIVALFFSLSLSLAASQQHWQTHDPIKQLIRIELNPLLNNNVDTPIRAEYNTQYIVLKSGLRFFRVVGRTAEIVYIRAMQEYSTDLIEGKNFYQPSTYQKIGMEASANSHLLIMNYVNQGFHPFACSKFVKGMGLIARVNYVCRLYVDENFEFLYSQKKADLNQKQNESINTKLLEFWSSKRGLQQTDYLLPSSYGFSSLKAHNGTDSLFIVGQPVVFLAIDTFISHHSDISLSLDSKHFKNNRDPEIFNGLLDFYSESYIQQMEKSGGDRMNEIKHFNCSTTEKNCYFYFK